MAEVNYSFGWHPSLPDFRDFIYECPLGMAAMPSKFDLSLPSPGFPFDPCFDQGNLGSCGPNSESGNIAFDLIASSFPNAAMPSRLFLYYNARVLMGTVNSDSGVDNRTMLKALAKYGFCDETLWPYDITKFKNKPSQACYDQAAQRAGNIVYQAVPQSLDQMKGCLYDLKRPFIFGFSVYSSMMTHAVANTGDIPMPKASDSLLGGHDILIVGFDDEAQRFKIKNSWGTTWGKSGYGTIPYSYATNSRLSSDFWVVTKASADSPTPTPTPTPTPPAPSVLKDWIDQIFDALLAQFSGNVTISMIIQFVKGLVDKYLTTKNMANNTVLSSTQVKDIVDMIFAALETQFAAQPFVVAALKLINSLIDQYLDSLTA